MTRRVVLFLLLCVGLATPSMAGRPEPSRSLDRLAVDPEATVFVLTTGGAELRGRLVRTSEATGVDMLTGDGRLLQVSAADVVRIWRRGDSVRNGLLIGSAIGAAGLVVAASSCRHDCASFATGMVLGAGVWAGAGALVDAARTGRTLIYQRP
jgi:hypothetical protein